VDHFFEENTFSFTETSENDKPLIEDPKTKQAKEKKEREKKETNRKAITAKGNEDKEKAKMKTNGDKDKEKAAAKSRAILTTSSSLSLSSPSLNCGAGECCDLQSGKYKAKGTLCQSSPCSAPSACLGVSSHCPPSSSFAQDGSLCPGGSCKTGVCVATTPLSSLSSLPSSLPHPKASPSKEGKVHDATNPSVYPSSDGMGKTKFFVGSLKVKCTQGGCCDQSTGFVKAMGAACTSSKHECYEAMGTCNGYESKCPRKAVEDGTECSTGMCVSGRCRASAKQKEATRVALEQESVAEEDLKLSSEAEKRNEELDNGLAELEAKIAKAKKRQRIIKKALLHNENESKRSIVRHVLDKVHKKIKTEHDLAKRSLYPYQITATLEEAQDNKESDFNIHKYVKRLAEEEQRYNTDTLSMAAANLQASNGTYESFPWFAAGALMLLVVIVSLIVGIVKAAKSKKSKAIKDEEYEKF
jgi:hypothetical protein